MNSITSGSNQYPGFQTKGFGINAEEEINASFSKEINNSIVRRLYEQSRKSKIKLPKEVVYNKIKEKKAKRRANNASRKINQAKNRLNKFQK